MEFGRIAAQSAKQVIVQKVREAERDKQYDEFIGRVNEIVNGTVKRVEYGNVIVDLGKGEGIIRRDEQIPRELFRYGATACAPSSTTCAASSGARRSSCRAPIPQFMAKLFTMEVPEIYDGIIEIKAVARDPGSRAKIAVVSRDSSVDPVGACVGMRGSRVRPSWRTAGREDRHHSLVAGRGLLPRQCAAAGGSRQGRARRGRRAH